MDVTRLQQAPPSMYGFLLKPSLGRWFVQFRKAPCTFATSSEFQDYETNMYMDGKNSVVISETVRNDLCNTMLSRLYIQSPPETFVSKFPLGNMFSGSYIIPATDYKTFSITYGCSKMSVSGDKCDDPWLSIKTRIPFPNAKVINMIKNALMQLWRITVDQLQPVQHQQYSIAKTPYKVAKAYVPFIQKKPHVHVVHAIPYKTEHFVGKHVF